MTLRAVPRASRPEAADVALGLALAQAKDHPAVKAAGTAGEIGSWPSLLALSAGTLVLGLLTKERRLTEAGARMLGAGILASAAKTSLKRAVHRTRPNVLMESGLYARGRLGPNVGPWQSFPSGHAALSTAVACAIGRARPDLRGPAYAAAAGVAAAQVLRGAHFPADVVAGALIGVAAEAAIDRLAFRHGGRPQGPPAGCRPGARATGEPAIARGCKARFLQGMKDTAKPARSASPSGARP